MHGSDHRRHQQRRESHADQVLAPPARRVEGEIKAGEAIAMGDGETRSERHGNGEREQA